MDERCSTDPSRGAVTGWYHTDMRRNSPSARAARALRRALCCALCCAACDDGAGAPTGDAGVPDAATAWRGTALLAATDAWQPVSAEADPFADRPEAVTCPPHGARDEDGLFEVETDICRYGTFAQPLPVDLRAGDVIVATVWHLQLWAAERTQGHVALQLGDALLWERYVPIPGHEAVYPLELPLAADAPAGTPLYFHVHNHGANSWRVLAIEARRD